MRPVMTLRLYRPNTHLTPRPVLDAWEIIKFSTALFLYCVIGWLVML